ncbi:MAG: hypothetical protein IJ316_01885 [Clostridia bacterium]|nr:hypothetical protein [Clostridia bacterium]
MKKLLCLLMALVVVFSFAACNSGDDSSEESKKVASGAKKGDSEVVSIIPEEITVKEQVIYDADDVKVTVKGISFDGYFGPELDVLIENNNEYDITVCTSDSTVNGLVVDCSLYCDVPAGKKANDTILIDSIALESSNIEIIKDVEFILYATDSEYERVFESDYIKVTTTAPEAYVQEIDDSGYVAVDDENVKVIIKHIEPEKSIWGTEVLVYLENNTDRNLCIQTVDVSVNGFAIDPYFSTDVPAGKKAFDTITFSDTDLEDNDIDEITEMELKFEIIDWDDWDYNYESGIVSVVFE